MQQPISPAGPNDFSWVNGFTLLETLCVIAILAALAGIVFSVIPPGTSKARLQSYAIATAALLKDDRNAAIRRRGQIVTQVDAGSRSLRSGATGRIIKIPDDVTFEALLSARCSQYSVGRTIRFFSSGMSCGGAIALTRSGVGYEVRVNWLTGGVEVVSLNRT